MRAGVWRARFERARVCRGVYRGEDCEGSPLLPHAFLSSSPQRPPPKQLTIVNNHFKATDAVVKRIRVLTPRACPKDVGTDADGRGAAGERGGRVRGLPRAAACAAKPCRASQAARR